MHPCGGAGLRKVLGLAQALEFVEALPPQGRGCGGGGPVGGSGFTLVFWLEGGWVWASGRQIGGWGRQIHSGWRGLWGQMANISQNSFNMRQTWSNLNLKSSIFEGFRGSCWLRKSTKNRYVITRKVRICEFLILAEAKIRKLSFRGSENHAKSIQTRFKNQKN